MSLLKKIIAGVSASALVLSLAGCADISTAVTINDEDIKAGIYLYYEYEALSNASSAYEEANPDVDTSVEGFDYFTTKIEDKDFSTWVTDETKRLILRYVAVDELFEENKLTLTEDEKTELKDGINETWDTENSYLAYYGINFNTMGEYYESLGVSKASYTSVMTNAKMEENLFLSLYGTDGSEPVAEKDIETYFKENYARTNYIAVALTDANGKTISTDEGLKIMKDLAQGYVDRLANGEDFATVKKDYTDYVEAQKAAADADTEDADDAEVGESGDEAEVGESDDKDEEEDNDVMIKIDTTSPSEEFVKKLFRMDVNEPTLLETEGYYYVINRLDIMERTDWLEKYNSTILHALKDEDFDKIIEKAYEDYTYEENKAAIEAYSPEILSEKE